MTNTNNDPATSSEVTAIIETRRSGQRSRYPNEQMKRLLHSGAKVPWWRRVMRWVKGVGR